MGFVCANCRKAADKKIIPHSPKMCRGKTWCDCQHGLVGK